jgi:hypothetical protein
MGSECELERGTRREVGVYVINRCEESMRIPVPGVNERILQVGKKSRSNVRRRCWESEVGDVGVRKQEVEGMRIDGRFSARRKL